MKKNLLLSILTLLLSISAFAQKTYSGPASGNWNVAGNWSPSGVPTSADDVIIPSGKTVTIDVDAFAKSISVSGTLYLDNSYRLTVGTSSVNGNFTVNSGGTFKINQTGTLIVYGNYTNNGTTDFWKGDVLITGNLTSPTTSAIQNQGNVLVGGDIIGNFNLTGGQGTNQIYPLNPNATVSTNTPTATPGTPFTENNNPLIDLINTVLYGGNCTFAVNAPSDKTVCEGTAAIFTVTTDASGPNCQWQINTGSGWSDLANTAMYSGVTSLTLTITGVTTGMTGYEYRAKITNSGSCTKNGNFGELTVMASPSLPTLGSVTQPTCTVTNGSFSITNYNASYTYSVSPSTGVTITGANITAPAGTYTVTATLGSCTSGNSSNVTLNAVATNTWNGTTWSTGTAPLSTEKIVFAGNYSSTSNITGCSCQINSGNVVVNAGHTLTVTDAITVSGGSLTFEDTSSLLQTNTSAVNSGNIIYKRKTTPLKQYDYTYWSTPVANATLSQLATNSLFYAYDAGINNWVQKSASNTMVNGQGYIGRAPNGLNYATPQTLETSFTGVPNNGTITTPITKGAGILNLIGNPYPSAIDIDLFLTDAANSGLVNGTIYLWTHNTAISSSNPGNNTYNYTANDYAKYNLTGGVKTASAALTGGAAPTGKIAAGQGFFIEANSALANGTYSATFKNSMRVSGNNTQFFRSAETESDNTTATPLEKHRVWISLSNNQGAYNEALVGYIQGATNDLDRLFDGKTLPAENVVSFYSLLSNDKLSIQGRSLPFNTSETIPMGYSTTLTGDFSIRLENFDGLFANQDIYLLDKTTGIYHNLKAGDFTFTTTNGTFNDRFELRFTTATLGVNTVDNNDSNIRIIAKDQHLSVLSGMSNISSIEVYNLLGKLIYSKKDIQTNEFHTDTIPATSQMLIVTVTLENQKNVTKKVLIP